MQLSLDRLEEILGRAAEVRAVVVGDVMLDVYLTGSVTRISPEAPVPVVQVLEESSAVGGAANVAANIAALGARCDLVGVIGRDPAADEIRRVLASLGPGQVADRLVAPGDRPTTTKTRVMARHQQVVRFDREVERELPDDCAREICDVVRQAVAEADVLVLEDYNKGVLVPPVIRAALAAAAERGTPSVVDPKFQHFFEYAGCTVFKPNAAELRSALGTHLRPGDDAWLEEARRRAGAQHLLLTLGEEGMALRCGNGTTARIPTEARDVYDVSGAGDTVTAFVAVALAAGATIHEAAVLANHAAGIEVGKAGVATVSPDELRSALALRSREAGAPR